MKPRRLAHGRHRCRDRLAQAGCYRARVFSLVAPFTSLQQAGLGAVGSASVSRHCRRLSNIETFFRLLC